MKQCQHLFDRFLKYKSHAHQWDKKAEAKLGKLLACCRQLSNVTRTNEKASELLGQIISQCKVECDRHSEAFYYYASVIDLLRSLTQCPFFNKTQGNKIKTKKNP